MNINPPHIEQLLALRHHLTVVHHVQGRIRLRFNSTAQHHIAELPGKGLETLLASVQGINQIRLNSAAASVIIDYDPQRLPPETWETLATGSDENVQQLIIELVQTYQ